MNYFGQDGLAVDDDMQDATLEEGLHLVISDTHPWCPWQLPGLIAECAEARAAFHTEEQLDAFFGGGGMGGGRPANGSPTSSRSSSTRSRNT